MAAMLMAGLDGVKRNLDPASLGLGPYDEDVFSWPEPRREKLLALPRSLEEAVKALSADRAFLAAGGVFPTEVIDLWMARCLVTACGQIAARPHPYEFELYYDC
jgi:glutamine synthetase